MKSKSVFITAKEWFESTSPRNPIICMDHKLEQFFSDYYNVNYDIKLLATTAATKEEKESPFHNDYRERYSSEDIYSLNIAL